MAKISSPWVGNASGKLGEAVYYRTGGNTLARSKASSVKNPQSAGQMITRIAFATASRAYSFLQALANHAFQNYAYGADNQKRFMKLNVGMLRDKLSVNAALRLGKYNFNKKDQFDAVINEYVVSEGNLPVVPVAADINQHGTILVPQAVTYQDVCDKLGLPAGSQLTFLVLESDATAESGGIARSLHFARVILQPSDGDMTSAFLGTNGAVNKPNEKNEGTIIFDADSSDGLGFIVDNLAIKNEGAVAVIASAYENGKWRRSTQKFVLRADLATGDNAGEYSSETYGDVEPTYLPSASTNESDKYLNEGE